MPNRKYIVRLCCDELRAPITQMPASFIHFPRPDQTEVFAPVDVRHITLPLGVVKLGLEQDYRPHGAGGL